MARKINYTLEPSRLARNAYERARYHRKRAERAAKIDVCALAERQAERNARRKALRLMAVAIQSIPMPLHSPRHLRIFNRMVSNAA